MRINKSSIQQENDLKSTQGVNPGQALDPRFRGDDVFFRTYCHHLLITPGIQGRNQDAGGGAGLIWMIRPGSSSINLLKILFC